VFSERFQNKQRLFPHTVVTDWFLGAFAKLRKATISFVMSVRPSAWNNSALTERILIKFDILEFSRKSIEKIQVSLKSDKNNGTLHEDVLHL
jgi:hypothetical protein